MDALSMVPGDEVLDDLNEDQLRAVTHGEGPLLVLAGAGSGKTRVITRRIAYLVRHRGVHPANILAVTFTNKAAQEMRDRVQVLLSGRDAPQWIGTFHSICLKWLRIYAERLGYPKDFVVYDEDDQESVLKRVVREMGFQDTSVARFKAAIEYWKNEGIWEPEPPDSPRRRQEYEVFLRYQQALREARAMDFGDLLCNALRLLVEDEGARTDLQSHFLYVLVDEFQDTNRVQYEILKALVKPHRNLCVVGDDDQSIYSWRGARVENILDFRDDFPDAAVVTLRTNYRSRKPILDAATRLIGANRRRHRKELVAYRGPGQPVRVQALQTEMEEARFVVNAIKRLRAEGVPLSNIAVFYRTHAQSRPFEDALRMAGIPYVVVGGVKFYQRKEIKDLIAYLRVLVNPADSVSLERILNVPPRGLGPSTLSRARELAVQYGEPLLLGLGRLADMAGPAIRERIRSFTQTIMDLAEEARTKDAATIIEATLERTGYLEYLSRDETPEGQNRVENVMELVASARDLSATTGQRDLKSFLDRIALLQPVDTPSESDGAKGEGVNLMTIHASKGLEFEHCFLCGVEESLIPHFNSVGRQADLEEERRLMYVAMTRARESLTLTWAATRLRMGRVQWCQPSRFLADLGGRR